jgi:hypothetical protein
MHILFNRGFYYLPASGEYQCEWYLNLFLLKSLNIQAIHDFLSLLKVTKKCVSSWALKVKWKREKNSVPIFCVVPG